MLDEKVFTGDRFDRLVLDTPDNRKIADQMVGIGEQILALMKEQAQLRSLLIGIGEEAENED